LDATMSPCIVKAMDNTVTTPYLEQSGYWVDPSFFDIFSFHFLHGDRKTALNEPNTIVLSQQLAKKLFGAKYAIGKMLKAGDHTYIVTGVFKEDMLNHIAAGFFASNNSEGIRDVIAKTNNWVVNPNYYTYLRLKPGTDVQTVVSKLQAYTQKYGGAGLKSTGDHMTNGLQALSAIHMHSSGYLDYLSYKQGNLKYLYLLGSIAAAILLLGCINYMNLSTAQAIDRAREVGVRRVLGAGKNIIRYQFLAETIVISVLALLLGIALAFIFLPAFNSITGQQLSFFSPENSSLILWLLLITFLSALLAGIYPAFYLSSFKPVTVLKGKIASSGILLNVRQVLVSGQFIIATCLIIATLVIWNQLQYMMNAKTGVDQTQQLVINLNSAQAAKNSAYLIQQLKANPGFQSVAGAAGMLVSGDMNMYPQEKTITDKRSVFLNLTDSNYAETLGLQFIAGGNFSPVTFGNTDMAKDLEANDIGRQIILNEEAVKTMGYPTAQSAIGKYLSRFYNNVVYQYKIVGVVKNYHYFSLHAAIGAHGIIPANPLRFTTIIAKIKSGNTGAAIKFTEQQWKQLNPDTPFNYSFMNDAFRWDYLQDQRQQQMMGSFTVIAIVISCLGLLGLVTYTISQKAKEIGIRKVIGAGVADIVLLFSAQYLKLILIANLIAWPIAWYFMNRWLLDFPYRITISWWIFVASLIAGLLVALLTLGYKTIIAALKNPVISLRAE
jgi:putative ABC transport system permease protein